MPGYDAGIWIGLLAPKGTPTAVVDKLAASADDALKVAQVAATLKQQGTDVVGGTPKEFADYIKADIAKWTAAFAAGPGMPIADHDRDGAGEQDRHRQKSELVERAHRRQARRRAAELEQRGGDRGLLDR